MIRTAAAGEQPGGRPHKERATYNAKASQWADRCGEGWIPGRKGAGGQGLAAPTWAGLAPGCACPPACARGRPGCGRTGATKGISCCNWLQCGATLYGGGGVVLGGGGGGTGPGPGGLGAGHGGTAETPILGTNLSHPPLTPPRYATLP